MSREGRQRTPALILALIGGVLVLTATAVAWGLPNNEAALTDAASSALDAADLDLEVTIDGRDAAIAGVVGDHSEIDRAHSVVSEIHGIRVVDISGISVIKEPPLAASLRLGHDGEIVVIEGTVASEAIADAIVLAATDSLWPVPVTSELVVDPRAEGDWQTTIHTALAHLSTWRTGVITVGDDSIRVAGTVNSESGGQALVAGFVGATVLDVSYGLDVRGDHPPTFSARFADGALSLAGELADRSQIDAIREASAGYQIASDKLTIGPVAAAPWIDVLPSLMERMADWPEWSVAIDGGTGHVFARAPSSRSAEALTTGLLDRIGVEWTTNDIEVDAAALAEELTEQITGTIHFEAGSARLDEETLRALEDVAVVLLENPSTILTVEGHTDNEGRSAFNLTLSQDRAQAVVDFLVSLGVPESRLTAVGYGESRPIAENGTTIGRALNRRIEFVVSQESP